jgi:hypothetical protein
MADGVWVVAANDLGLATQAILIRLWLEDAWFWGRQKLRLVFPLAASRRRSGIEGKSVGTRSG